MAAEGEFQGEAQGEMQAHVRSYSRFTWMMKWGAIICLIVALGVMLLLRGCSR